MKWKDVDFSREILYIDDSKSGEGRDGPLNGSLKSCLSKLKQSRNGDIKDDDFVFLNRNATVYKDISRPFRKTKKRAGLEKGFRFHDLRHTAASHMAMKGVTMLALQKILGHKSIETTMRYAHLSPQHRSKALEKFNFLIDHEI